MAITQCQTDSFKSELYQAVHNLLSDTIKIALYTDSATLDQNTTAYTTSNEVVATGYTAGGVVMTGATINTYITDTNAHVACVSFNNASWNATITARGALIYNASKSNKSIAVLDFGATKTSTFMFIVQMPANTATSALIRSVT